MRLKIMGLCLVAVFATAAMAAASASAETLPKFNECAVLKTGTLAAKCNAAGKGHVIQEGIGKKHTFKGAGKASALTTPALKSEIACKTSKDVGTVTGEKTEGKILTTFTGCATLGKKCNSTGAKVGEIKTLLLKAELGYINAAKHEVGADITPESGKFLAEFECEGILVKTEGSVIGKVTPVNTFTTKETLTLGVNGSGEQEVKKLENQPQDVLESTIGGQGPFESGQKQTVVNTGENLEIEA